MAPDHRRHGVIFSLAPLLQPKSAVAGFGHSNKRSKSETSDLDGEGRGEGLFSAVHARAKVPSPGSRKCAIRPLPAPKSGLPDFGTQRRIEIGNSRFRLRGEVMPRHVQSPCPKT